MNTHNICFYGELMKIILKLSSNTLFICFTVEEFAFGERLWSFTGKIRMGISILWGDKSSVLWSQIAFYGSADALL